MITLNSNNKVITHLIDNKKRDLVLIIPGGGYNHTSVREAEPVSNAFLELGYHTAIYEYRHTLLKHPDVINEAIEVVEGLRNLDKVRKILIIGFSAGGHLALHLLETKPRWFKAGILCYPVVTSNQKYSHQGSFEKLLVELNKESLREVSLEKNVKKSMPPIFLWHTMTDQSVPVENSILLLEALNKKKVSVEAHFYPKGRHGLSLATKEVAFDNDDKEQFALENKHVATWFETLKNWLGELK
ncbi:conserved hypothetical protein [Alteracholeplasma palmae J233]|uniref:Peptidase S9 prolyl oligopeptidase catalytic domain-containing protein n=1 Tax=Alteracholeplasma palmae (strain ATCC 49389 / J233) TaxID=1318466 RepID=U4KKV7_ALTPJ|nr:prolyl oligopeptidase family serine peptidase [Alteracholeplasma palmae]CCV64318.1 conserved hypothetical protein [Alteracholeplasma palmae J233]